MSVAALKEEAIRQFAIKVEAIDDEAGLILVLDFLNGIRSEDKGAIDLARHYDSIKQRYSAVLEKLAK
jgi:hypothetical protein